MKQAVAVLFLAAMAWAQTPPRISQVVQFSGGSVAGIGQGFVGVAYGTDFGTKATVAVNSHQAEVYFDGGTFLTFRVAASEPVGQASVVLTTAAGPSAPFPFQIVAFNPAINFNSLSNPQGYFRRDGVTVPFTRPGDVITVGGGGFGAVTPPPTPKVFFDGTENPVLGTGSITGLFYGSGLATPSVTPGQTITFKVPDLQPGRHQVTFQAGGVTSPPVPMDVIYSGIITSQTGLTFNAVQGGPAPLAQSLAVLSGIGTINFNLTSSTVSGGGWLSVTPTGGSALPAQVGVPIKVAVNPAGLAAGAYYGTIQVSADGVLNSPQTVTVVLRIAPAGTAVGPFLDTSGLVFVGTQTGGDPPPQTVTIANPTTASLSYTSGISITAGTNQWSYSPLSASVNSGQTAALPVQAKLAGAAPGVYTARITLAFSDSSTRTISLLLVVAANTGAPKTGQYDAAGCTPTKLLPVFSQPGAAFNVAAAWPWPILVTVVNDCGDGLFNGNANVTFNNGDPAVPLASLRNGTWAGTWSSVNPKASVGLTVSASDPVLGLSGSAALTGGVSLNADVPVISKGGILDAASYGSALSPGGLFLVFGLKLAGSDKVADSLPWQPTLADTTVLLGNKPVPMYYTSEKQLSAMVPYDAAQNAQLQVVVRSGNAISSPQPVSVVPARPAVWTVNQSGTGQAHVYRVDAANNQILADATNPAKPGDVLVIYCMGLGPVDPPVQAGVAAPLDKLSRAVNPVTARVGGLNAAVAFAGLTPGFAALYQVNLTVPVGVPDNDATVLVLSAGGQDSVGVTFAVRSGR